MPFIKEDQMTLGQFFELCEQNGSIVIFYFVSLLLTSVLAGIFGKGEGHLSPWKYLYSFLVYASCVPGIFAATLNIYLFFFERRSVMDANLYTQVLPILVMFLCLWIIKRNVSFKDIPGFGRLGSLVTFLAILISLLWFLEKTHIVVFSYIPFSMFILIFVATLVILRFVLKSVIK